MSRKILHILCVVILSGCSLSAGSKNPGIAYNPQWEGADLSQLLESGKLNVLSQYTSATGALCKKYMNGNSVKRACRRGGKWYPVNSFSGR